MGGSVAGPFTAGGASCGRCGGALTRGPLDDLVPGGFCRLLVPDGASRGEYVAVGRPPYVLRRALPSHFWVIIELIEQAADWLRGKQTDQWAEPWPDARTRDERVQSDLDGGKTWIVWHATIPVATITIDTGDPRDPAARYLWPPGRRRDQALYVRRVVVRRSYAGRGLGAALLDWAAEAAMQLMGTPLLRIDVWTENRGLHAYYQGQGFMLCAWRHPWELPGYPSRALFERRAMPETSDGDNLFSVPGRLGPG